MRQFFSLLLFMLVPVVLFSQTTWREGTITTKDGTVVKGEINDLEWNYAPTEIDFRKDAQSPNKKYTTKDIVSFSTNRPALYELHSVAYDGDTQQLNNLPSGKEPTNLVREKVFLQVLVNAKIGLLFLREENERLHYFIKQDTLITELLNRNYMNPKDVMTMLTFQGYIQQLTLITNDCQDIQKSIKYLPYKEDRLRKVITQINQCKSNKIESIWVYSVAARKPSDFGITLQGFITDAYGFNSFTTSPSKLNFGGGAFWEFYSKAKPNRISLYNELVFKVLSQPCIVDLWGPVEDTYECKKIKLINAIRLSYPDKSGKGGRFYFGVGLNTGFKTDLYFAEENLNPDIFISSNFEVGTILMLGKTFVLFNSFKMNTEFRFELEVASDASFNYRNLGLSTQFNLR